jgi:hypothetical protein
MEEDNIVMSRAIPSIGKRERRTNRGGRRLQAQGAYKGVAKA